ncbi:MAG: hypothetical protein AAGA29_08290 [Planctomycetota bacterium]
MLFPVMRADAQWEDEMYGLRMDEPGHWFAMSEALLGRTNQEVRHITGGVPFLAGYQPYEAERLVFPYMLVQFMPYTELPEPYRPQYRLGEYGMLQLISRLVPAIQAPDPLPELTNTHNYARAYGGELVRLDHLDPDGRFVLIGTIPMADGQGRIAYYTVGALGREGVAYMTIFTRDPRDHLVESEMFQVEFFGELLPVIESMGTALAFIGDAGWTGLPERDPEEVAGSLSPGDPAPGDGSPTKIPGAAPAPGPAGQIDGSPADLASVDATGSLAMPIILGSLGLMAVLVVVVVVVLSHQKAARQREKARARRQRSMR